MTLAKKSIVFNKCAKINDILVNRLQNIFLYIFEEARNEISFIFAIQWSICNKSVKKKQKWLEFEWIFRN